MLKTILKVVMENRQVSLLEGINRYITFIIDVFLILQIRKNRFSSRTLVNKDYIAAARL